MQLPDSVKYIGNLSGILWYENLVQEILDEHGPIGTALYK